MTARQGFQIAGGIVTALAALVASIILAMGLERFLPSGWGLWVPFALLAAVGVAAWFKRRARSSAFLSGLVIGICFSILLCASCDAWIFTR